MDERTVIILIISAIAVYTLQHEIGRVEKQAKKTTEQCERIAEALHDIYDELRTQREDRELFDEEDDPEP